MRARVFETVLVADRGPVARRVVRTCQRSGARTVVVHASGDAGSPAVRAADEAVPLGGRDWGESYGDPLRVLEAARRTGAEAVHPGGGPLAADAALARAVLDAGLVWLGLPPDVLALSEQQTVRLVQQAGIGPASAHGRRLVATVLDDAGSASVLGVREQLTRDGAPVADLQPADLPAEVLRAVEHAALVVVRAAGAGPLAAVGLTVDGVEVGVAAVLPVLLPGSSAAEVAAGVDLIALQLRLAGGEPIDPPAPGAHAVALHVRAADRFAGRLRRLVLSDDDDVAVDAAAVTRDRIAVSSDRTLAVVTVRADSRGAAVARARVVAEALVVEGVPTSLPAVRTALADLHAER